MSSLKFKNKGLKMKENICANCEKFGNVSLFKGKLLCADCLSVIAMDSDIANKMLSKKENNMLELQGKALLNYYNQQTQLLKLSEELSELNIEVVKFIASGKAPENLISEVADVYNMLYQLRLAQEYTKKEIDFIRKQKNIIALKRAGIEAK